MVDSGIARLTAVPDILIGGELAQIRVTCKHASCLFAHTSRVVCGVTLRDLPFVRRTCSRCLHNVEDLLLYISALPHYLPGASLRRAVPYVKIV